MKSQRLTTTFYAIAIAVLFVLAVMPFMDRASAEEPDPEKLAQLENAGAAEVGIAAAISYISQLLNGHPAAVGLAQWRTISNSALWDYYYFYGIAGQPVVLEAHRTTWQMDPAITLFFGMTNDSTGLFPTYSTQPGMIFVAWADDNNGWPHGIPGPFADPQIAIVLPSTGWYTLAVYDFVGGTPPALLPYDLLISGVAVPVDIDIKPGSDPNSINLKSKGVIPVAILGSVSFDVTDVDVNTVTFEGASPAHDLTDPDTYADHLQDVNGDGFTDLVCHFRTQNTGLVAADTEGELIGVTNGGLSFRGTDSVNIVKAAPSARSSVTTTWASLKSK